MEDALKEIFNLIAQRKNSQAAKMRGKAQEEYFKLKDKLGITERKACENIDRVFSCIENRNYNEARTLLQKAMGEYNLYLLPVSKANPNSAVQPEKYTTKIQVTPQPVNDNTKPAPENVNTNVSGQKPVASNDKTGNATTIISKEEQMRTSKEASEKLRKNNPNIADLSDANRPTKTVERFSELYDNEWTEAYIDIAEKQHKDDRKAVDQLYQIALAAYDFCVREAKRQVEQMQEAAISIMVNGHVAKKPPAPVHQKLDTYNLKQFRKEVAGYAVERLKKDFMGCTVRTVMKTSGVKLSKPVQTYAEKCTEIIWWMCVQNPPVFLHKGEKGTIDHTLYKPYTKSGQIAEFYIWPALLLHENGPTLSKGIVQAK